MQHQAQHYSTQSQDELAITNTAFPNLPLDLGV
jgi:hypothetical protein